jgi:hypothetical protein
LGPGDGFFALEVLNRRPVENEFVDPRPGVVPNELVEGVER